MGIFRPKEICKFCRRVHRKKTNCKDVNGCYCPIKSHQHIRHRQYMLCTESNCPCVYKPPGPVPAAAMEAK